MIQVERKRFFKRKFPGLRIIYPEWGACSIAVGPIRCNNFEDNTPKATSKESSKRQSENLWLPARDEAGTGRVRKERVRESTHDSKPAKSFLGAMDHKEISSENERNQK